MESQNTRRRYRSASKENDVTEIRSGIETGDDRDDVCGYSQDKRRRQRNNRRNQRRRRNDESSFFILFLQVGTTILLLCLAIFHIYEYIRPSISKRDMSSINNNEYGDDDDIDDAVNAMNLDDGKGLKLNQLLPLRNTDTDKAEKTKATIQKTAPPLPTFELTKSAEWDVFSTFGRFSPTAPTTMATEKKDTIIFWQAARELQENFAEIYGGENAARMLLDRGMTTFRVNEIDTSPIDVVVTACRFRQAKLEKRAFRIAFGGYSVTTGRGNRHKDSYPFQLREFLGPITKLAGIRSLQVNNAAIGGVPSFPYGWCMKEFWGGKKKTTLKDEAMNGTHNNNTKIDSIDANFDVSEIPDVVSWDFGMNEPGGPEGLEAYVRHLLSTYSSSTGPSSLSHLILPPKLIIKDYFTADHRREVLAEYSSLLKDPVVLHTDIAVEPFLARAEEFRPPGFKKWREWGSPKGAPGQASHHPAVQEHKLNGYILAMHFVTALEYMIAMEEREKEKRNSDDSDADNHHWCQQDSLTTSESLSSVSSVPTFFSLPPPVSRKIANETKLHYDGILFGNPIMDQSNINNNNNVAILQNGSFVPWIMNPVRCRTTFEPKLSGDLSEIIVNGSAGEDLDVLLPKSQYYYNKGWTLDLSEAEKAAKRKLSVYPNGLGFRDSKEAYYGIYESPQMTLLLPYETSLLPKAGDSASDFYQSLVVCSVNEKNVDYSIPHSCNFATDVGVRIGGISVTQNDTKMFDTIGLLYLGKPICKHVKIPSEARLTSHNTLLNEVDDPVNGFHERNDYVNLLENDETGLLVEVFVSNRHIVHINQACSLSHVLWEEKATNHRLQKSNQL